MALLLALLVFAAVGAFSVLSLYVAFTGGDEPVANSLVVGGWVAVSVAAVAWLASVVVLVRSQSLRLTRAWAPPLLWTAVVLGVAYGVYAARGPF